MQTYKLFKKTNNFLKFLTPLSEDNRLRVAKLISEDSVSIGNNEDCETFIEINQCPKIYVGMSPICKNMETGVYDELGEIVDIQYDEGSGYLFIFNK